jgi:hypothetical protein
MTFTIAMAFADVTQVKLRHIQVYLPTFGNIGKRVEAEGANVQIVIHGSISIPEDMVEVEGHLQVGRAALLQDTLTFIADILTAAVPTFLINVDGKVNAPAVFLSGPDDDQAVAGCRAR